MSFPSKANSSTGSSHSHPRKDSKYPLPSITNTHALFLSINNYALVSATKKKVFDFIPHHPQVIIPVPYRVVYTLCCICVLTSFIAQPTTMWAFLCHHTTGRVLIKVTNHLYEHFSHFTGPRGRQNNAHSPKMSMP